MISLASVKEAHSRMTKCFILKLVNPRKREWVFGACLGKIRKINTYSPLLGFFIDNYCVSQSLWVKELFDSPSLLELTDLLLNCIGVLLERPPRLLLLRGCTWVYIQTMAYELWINYRGFVCTLSENI